MDSRAELSSWLMPPAATAEWLTLAALLDEIRDADVPCRAGDPEAWWPNKNRLNSPETQAACLGCLQCPARVVCLDYALAADERYGIWGGMLPAERKSLERLAA